MWLQLTVCKLLDMTVRSFVARMETINGYLPAFPTSPGQPATMLSDMELKELLWRAIPRKWQIRLQDKRVKRHAITCNKFIAEIKMIQAVKMQQRILDKKGQKTKTKLTNRDKDQQSGASAKKRKTNKHKIQASGCQYWQTT